MLEIDVNISVNNKIMDKDNLSQTLETVTVDKCIQFFSNQKTWMTKEVQGQLKEKNHHLQVW